MSKVPIGDSERIGEATPQWINEQINRRRADGLSVCVQVIFDQKPLEFALSPTGSVKHELYRPAVIDGLRHLQWFRFRPH